MVWDAVKEKMIAEITRGVDLPNAQHQGVPPQEEPVDIGMYDDLFDEWDVEENINVEKMFAADHSLSKQNCLHIKYPPIAKNQ